MSGGPKGGDDAAGAADDASLVDVEVDPCRWREKIPSLPPPATGFVGGTAREVPF